MTKVHLVAALLVLVSGAHPCDVPEPTVFREPSSKLEYLKLGFCHQPDDDERVGFVVQNNEREIDLGFLEPQTSPNANGLRYYETGTMTLWPGVLTVRAYTASSGVSAPSEPITLTVNGKPKLTH